MSLSAPGLSSLRHALYFAVDTLFELLTNLEERELLRWNWDLLASLRITSFVGAVFLNYKAAETPDLDTPATHERVTHLAVNQVNDLFRLNYADLRALSELLNKF